jgi:hypothetical protein
MLQASMRATDRAGVAFPGLAAHSGGSATTDLLRQRWHARLTEHHARVATWLDRRRDADARGRASLRRQAQLLAASARLLAGEGLFVRALAPAPALPDDDLLDLPPLMLGAADDAELAVLIERAAAHQQRALNWLRRARNATMGAVIASQRRSMLLRGLEHIMAAEQCLRRAQRESDSADLSDVLARHLSMLDDTAKRAEQMVRDLDAESGS